MAGRSPKVFALLPRHQKFCVSCFQFTCDICKIPLQADVLPAQIIALGQETPKLGDERSDLFQLWFELRHFRRLSYRNSSGSRQGDRRYSVYCSGGQAASTGLVQGGFQSLSNCRANDSTMCWHSSQLRTCSFSSTSSCGPLCRARSKSRSSATWVSFSVMPRIACTCSTNSG